MAKHFEIGELVWAKMRKYPFWPGEITEPPLGSKIPSQKKPHHYVFFFGSDNCAWIPDENIEPHSEEMLLSCSKIKSTQFQKAVDKIRKEGLNIEKEGKRKESESEEDSDVKLLEESQSCTKYKQRVAKKLGNKNRYEIAKKNYFEKIQKKAQNRYIAKIHKKVRKQSAVDKCKSNKTAFSSEKQYPKTQKSTGFHCVAVNRFLEDFPFPPIITKDIEPIDKKIGFIGLGHIGQRVVRNLLDTGHKMTIWNRSSYKCEEFVDAGATQARTPADLVAQSDIIFSCLSGSEAVRSVFFRDNGIVSGLEKSENGTKCYVELSTCDAATAVELGSTIKRKGGKFLEAPLFGSQQFASAGSMLVLASGDLELFQECESCFYAISNNAYYLSTEIGIGSKMNILLNMYMGTTHSALAEAMALIQRCDLSQRNFLQFLNQSCFSCPLLATRGRSLLSDDYSTSIKLEYQQRNLNMALSVSDVCEQPTLLAAAANERFKHALQDSDENTPAFYLGDI